MKSSDYASGWDAFETAYTAARAKYEENNSYTGASSERNDLAEFRAAFSSYHPLVNFLFFAMVLVFSMCFMHPVCLVISLGSATAYNLYLKGRKGLRFSLAFLLPMMLLAAIINPAFTHQGVTILGYTPNGNPITLESIVYGLAAAFMLAAVVQWFSCYNEVMTSDKFVYLFGRIIPALSLVLSMTLRFVPRFTAQLKVIRKAQRCVGRDVSNGSIPQRIRQGVTILSILVTWSLENAIETADSMKSRGYGLPGRSAFSIYRFDERDKYALIWLGFCLWYIVFGWVSDGLYAQYYPDIIFAGISPFPMSFLLVYLALCLTPLILNGREDAKWKRLRYGT